MKLPFISKWPIVLLLTLCAAAAHAVPVSHIQVRIVTGHADLSAGSYVELRIYEAGKAVRRLPLTHGEAWPRDSTRVIPLTLSDALDPRNVQRFSSVLPRREPALAALGGGCRGRRSVGGSRRRQSCCSTRHSLGRDRGTRRARDRGPRREHA